MTSETVHLDGHIIDSQTLSRVLDVILLQGGTYEITTTLVAGLRTAGISAPYVFEGAINGERFRAYIEQMLAPTLAPGDIVLLDNLRSHKVAGIAEAIAARGAQLIYLPPYSPDLNPIEQAFAKYKALLRKAAERTVESLWQTIGRIADLMGRAECRNFFNSAGYAT